MSDSSLLTGVYANVETYASLIDRVLEHLRIGGSNLSDPDQTRLGKLLVDAGDQGRSSQSLEALLFDSLLRSASGQRRADLKSLGQHLLGGTVEPLQQRQLEMLAKDLEKERAEVASRLRGR